MIRASIALVVLSGCFLELGSGVLVPTKHGHGNWGLPLYGTSGIDTKTPYGRIGGGAHFHVFVSPTNNPDSLAWGAGGVQLRNEVNLVPIWKRMIDSQTPYYNQHVVLVTTLSGGFGKGAAYRDDDTSGAKYVDIYVGVGIADHRKTKRSRWFAPSGGIAANRIWLGDRDPAWFLGVAFSFAGGLRLDPDE